MQKLQVPGKKNQSCDLAIAITLIKISVEGPVLNPVINPVCVFFNRASRGAFLLSHMLTAAAAIFKTAGKLFITHLLNILIICIHVRYVSIILEKNNWKKKKILFFVDI